VSGGVKNLNVYNGVIRDWASSGIAAQNADNGQLKDLRVSNNGAGGIAVGMAWSVAACQCVSNGTMPGLSIMANCSASHNSWVGFMTSGSCVLEGSAACFNGSNGFAVFPACRIVNCTSMNNKGNGFDASMAGEDVPSCKISGCTAAWNSQSGIIATYAGSIVENCVASKNTGDGINVGSRCFILQNSCDSNGPVGGGGCAPYQNRVDYSELASRFACRP
jgi:hypothetical protein